MPTEAELTEAALRLYFKAWNEIAEVINLILNSPMIHVEIKNRVMRPLGSSDGLYTEIESRDELADLLHRAQYDLSFSYSLIQQSQELALKAKICASSPYLLLLGTDVKSWARLNADFTDFRTLDASDLIKVANIVLPTPLSPRFKANYELLSRGRNKVVHLGASKEALDPIAMIDILVFFYTELFAPRNWMQDRREMLLASSQSHLYDKRTNETLVVLEEIAEMRAFLTKTQRRKLLGFVGAEPIYRCVACHEEAREGVFDNDEAATAILIRDPTKPVVAQLKCKLCGATHQVATDKQCGECGRKVICIEEDYFGLCCFCGFDTHDV